MADDRDNPPHLSVFLVLFIFFSLPDPLFMLILCRLSNVLRSGGVSIKGGKGGDRQEIKKRGNQHREWDKLIIKRAWNVPNEFELDYSQGTSH